ncbi:hypothetical protein [Actinoplanes subtropicus]|uniref:hypothetical protein n=1 Tax=Actinoplanes subtropicus TaxID=543632 RepID=UPI0004C44CB7|nr:hypothetical protein [Actinoplanes subtropicus]
MSRTPRTRSARRLAALVLTPVIAFAGTVAADLAVDVSAAHADDTYNPAVNSYNTYISRSEVLSRVRNWYNRARNKDSDLTYSSDLYTTDVDGDHTYRRDCSGLVDMAWHYDDSRPQPRTWELEGDRSITTRVDNHSDLQPGDILVDDVGSDNHAIVFQGWEDNAKTRFQYYSFGGTPMNHYPDGKLPDGSFDDPELAGLPTSHYTAYRYNHIVDSATGVSVAEDSTNSAQPIERTFLRGGDGSLWDYYYTGGKWNDEKIGGQIIGSPAAFYDSDAGLLRVFVQGADHALWQFYWDGATWTKQSIGGTLTSGVGALLDHGVVRVFGRGGDGQLWQYYYSGGSWHQQKIGGYILDNPAVMLDGTTLRVFMLGTDGQLWQYYYAGGAWTLQSIGGDFDSGFSATWYAGEIHVFGRASGTNELYQYYYHGGNWIMQNLGGEITSGTAVNFNGSNLNVYARGADGALWQDYYTGAAWHWQKIGGILA